MMFHGSSALENPIVIHHKREKGDDAGDGRRNQMLIADATSKLYSPPPLLPAYPLRSALIGTTMELHSARGYLSWSHLTSIIAFRRHDH